MSEGDAPFHFHLFHAGDEVIGPIASNLLSELEEPALSSLGQITDVPDFDPETQGVRLFGQKPDLSPPPRGKGFPLRGASSFGQGPSVSSDSLAERAPFGSSEASAGGPVIQDSRSFSFRDVEDKFATGSSIPKLSPPKPKPPKAGGKGQHRGRVPSTPPQAVVATAGGTPPPATDGGHPTGAPSQTTSMEEPPLFLKRARKRRNSVVSRHLACGDIVHPDTDLVVLFMLPGAVFSDLNFAGDFLPQARALLPDTLVGKPLTDPVLQHKKPGLWIQLLADGTADLVGTLGPASGGWDGGFGRTDGTADLVGPVQLLADGTADLVFRRRSVRGSSQGLSDDKDHPNLHMHCTFPGSTLSHALYVPRY